MKSALVALVIALGSAPASAAIIASGPVGGFATFTDTDTNLQWLRLDVFFGKTINQMVAEATTAGFTYSAAAQVNTLRSHLPQSDIATWSQVTGHAPNRDIVWAAYSTAPGSSGSFHISSFYGWSTASVSNSIVYNEGSPHADLNIFAYRVADAVPEPAMLGLFGLGAIGLGLTRRRKAA